MNRLHPASFGAVVEDAGGGMVTLLVDRDTVRYPHLGAHVTVTVTPHRCDDCAVLLDDRGFHCGQAMFGYPAFTSLTIRAEKIVNESTRLWLVEDVMLRRGHGAELHVEGPKGTIAIPPSLRIGADVLALVDIVRADNA